MRKIPLILILFAPIFSLCHKPEDDQLSPSNKDTVHTATWKLIWSDEFNTASVDPETWLYERGYLRNNELQYYTDKQENVRLEDGNLVIETRKENVSGYAYTSGSINTRGKRSWKYGRFEMRARLPEGPGIWPAFWTCGNSGTWPQVEKSIL